MKSSHLLYIILLITLLSTACKDKEPETPGNSGDDIPAIATNTWLFNSLDDMENYTTTTPENRYDMDVVRNEYESVQIVIQTDSKKSLTIERSGDADAIEFQCRKVAAFNGKYDVLVPCDNEIEPEGKIVRAWLTFKIKPNAETKRYKEVIRFKEGSQEYAVAISLNVVDASLPETPSIASVFGINPQNFIFSGLSEEGKIEKRKEASDLLLEYRISPYFSTWLSGTMKTECFSSPYDWNDDRTWSYLADKRFNRIALPSHGLSDEELQAMLNKARENGLLEKAYFYLWDEPTKTAEYEEIRSMADRIHQYAPEAKVLTTFYCGPTDGEYKDDLLATFDLLNGATSLFCTSVWALQGSETWADRCKDKLRPGQEWWSYVCMSITPGLASNSTAIENRATMWRCYKEQTSGFLYWVVNGFASVYPLRPRSDLPEGDGVLIYPGESFDSDKLCTSIRLERWRDGAEEYDMLMMYEKKVGREATLSLLNNVYRGPTNYTNQSKYALALRKNLIEGISE